MAPLQFPALVYMVMDHDLEVSQTNPFLLQACFDQCLVTATERTHSEEGHTLLDEVPSVHKGNKLQ